MKRPIALLSLVLCLGGAMSSAAFAQPLSPAMAAKESLTDSDRAEIAGYVGGPLKDLKGTARQVSAARKTLLEPLAADSVSLPFRTMYAAEVIPGLTPLIADARDEVAFNALRVAGEIATNNSVDLLIKGLDDKRPAVRYAALKGLARTFEITAQKGGAGGGVLPDQLGKALRAIGSAAKTETDPELLDGAIIAIGRALALDNKDKLVQPSAVTEMAKLVRAQTAGLSGPNAAGRCIPLIRGAASVRTTVDNSGANMPGPSLIDAAGLSGDFFAAVAKAIKAGNPDKLPLEQMVRAAESLLYVANANPALTGTQPLTITLADLIKAGKDNQYLSQVKTVIGSGGVLTSPPYNQPADRYKFE